MKNKQMFTPIAMIILGIILLVVPGTVITTVIRILGIVIIVSIVFSIKNNHNNSYQLAYTILIGILGIIFITNPEAIASIIPLILGIWITMKSLFQLQFINILKRDKTIDWIKPLIINIIMLIIGIVLIFNPFKGAETLMRIIAIFILMYSILDIINFVLTKPRKVKVIKK